MELQVGKSLKKVQTRIIALTLTSSLGILSISNPASAIDILGFFRDVFNIDGYISEIFDTIGELSPEGFLDEIVDRFENELRREVNTAVFEPLSEAVEDIFGSSRTSAGGYLELRQLIEGAYRGEVLGADRSATSGLAQNSADRFTTIANVEAVLGDRGAEDREDTIETVEDIAEAVEDAVTAAQGSSVTQDVMKELVNIQASQTALISQIRLEMLRQRIDTAHANKNLVNVSRTLDQIRRDEVAKYNGSAAGNMNDSALVGFVNGAAAQ